MSSLATDRDIADIRDFYRTSLVFPATLPRTRYFVASVGLVGSGKTTVMKPLAERLSLVRVSNDEVRKLLKERGFSYERLIDVVHSLMMELAHEGYNLAFDADCANPKTKEEIENAAREVDAKIFWLHIAPPEDFILHKLRTYTHTWLFADGEEAVANYFRQKEKRAKGNVQFDFLATIDTSRPNLSAQIDRVANLIPNNVSS